MLKFLQNEDNGYTKRKVINNIDFKLMYKPTDLLVDQHLENNFSIQEVDSLRAALKDFMYFNLAISSDNREVLNTLAQDRAEFGKMVSTLSFNFQDKVSMVTSNKDTIQMVDFSYPRMYGLSRATSLLLVFPVEAGLRNSATIDVIVEDIGFQTGQVKFRYDVSLITNQPEINFSSIPKD
ncbi:hypothetical protein APR41_17645 [Salegentibacter salinarum]|uniref:Uncharacterized protein n=2 Tax=Salegentibacter salinarum TaxID=447422 RepID=A0A2N0TVG8_9FLAO|nr:hypothetical protein APR41_17645 [Salegentibacter salinarum]